MPEPEYLTIDHLALKDIIRIFSKIKVDPVTECWNWTGGLRFDYGVITYQRHSVATHRLLYAWLVGPLPKRQPGQKTPNLDHVVCNNTRCCNPVHLKLVPPRANILRTKSVSAINARKTHCVRGHLLTVGPDSSGRRSCSVCPNERARKFARTEHRKEYSRRYRQEHREQTNKISRESMRRRRAANPVASNEYLRSYELAHREQNREKKRIYHREYMRKRRAAKRAMRQAKRDY